MRHFGSEVPSVLREFNHYLTKITPVIVWQQLICIAWIRCLPLGALLIKGCPWVSVSTVGMWEYIVSVCQERKCRKRNMLPYHPTGMHKKNNSKLIAVECPNRYELVSKADRKCAFIKQPSDRFHIRVISSLLKKVIEIGTWKSWGIKVHFLALRYWHLYFQRLHGSSIPIDPSLQCYHRLLAGSEITEPNQTILSYSAKFCGISCSK